MADHEGLQVPVRPRTEMVLHVATERGRRGIRTRPNELHIEEHGLWVRGRYVPAPEVLGFEAVDPHQGETIVVATVVPLLSVAVIVLAPFLLDSPFSNPR